MLIVALALALVATTAVLATMAYYQTTIPTKEGTLTTAVWNIQVGNDETYKSFDINLASTTNTNTVAANKIAPGSSGSFDICLNNAGEVDSTYVITIQITDNGVPVTFKVDGNDIPSDGVTGSLAYNGKDGGTSSAKHTVTWEWAYGSAPESGDYSTAKTITATVSIVATQATVA